MHAALPPTDVADARRVRTESMDAERVRSASFRWLVGLALVLLVAFSASVRIRTALADPNFDAVEAGGMLKSDPALLFYFTERILEAGGVPADFRADPRVQHPGTTDIPAEFTVGQEFLIAFAFRWLGGDMPLHVFCVHVMAWTASLAALGVYLLAASLTRRRTWGLFAAALFVLAPASYRTIGFILVREDLALPFYALHLGLLALAFERRRPSLFLAAGVAAGAALATWHAMGFFFVVELTCVLLWCLRSRGNILSVRGVGAVLIGPVLAATLVPALRAQGALFSVPFQLLFVLFILSTSRAQWPNAGRFRHFSEVVVSLFGFKLVADLAGFGSSGYAHVWDVMAAKLVHIGSFPADPSELSFDARLLWQGPFDTLYVPWALEQHAWLLVLAIPAVAIGVFSWFRGRDAVGALVGTFALASLLLAWLFARMLVLPGLLLPVAAALLVARHAGRKCLVPVACVALLLQAALLLGFVRDHVNLWYLPPGRQDEIASLVRWIEDNVDEAEPIVGDFMNSTAILAHAGNPIVLQPKYETDRSRRRAEAFLMTFFHEPPAAMRALVRDDFDSRYVLFDRYTLGQLSRATAGLAPGAPLAPGSAAATFLDQDDAALREVPGFELVYRSPFESDFFRLYRVAD